MDESITSLIIQWYEDLEDRLFTYLKMTPYIRQNLGVRAPHLAGIITEACNILDSLLREVSPPTVNTKGRTKRQNDLNISDFAELYAACYNLPATKSLMYVSPPQYVIPFKEWEAVTGGGAYTPLPWWTAHTDLKHHRISEILNQATLSNAVDALCALHQVIAKLPQLVRATIRHELLEVGYFNPDDLIKHFENGRKNEDLELSHLLIETKLFVTPKGRVFPDDPSDIQPSYYCHSSRFGQFLGKR